LFSDPRWAALPLLCILGLLLLPGCRAVPPVQVDHARQQPLYDARAARLNRIDGWSLEGRLAVNDGKEGASGFLRWRQEGASSQLDFHGAFGRGAWRLLADAQGAELEFADGSRYTAGTVDELVRGQVGWSVPVAKLAWWVRGLAAPGQVTGWQLDDEGRLSALQQDGWSIEFGRYGVVDELPMPLKLTARRDVRMVKLAVKAWEFPGVGD
jgi:outer membrane lipoprotein LolB